MSARALILSLLVAATAWASEPGPAEVAATLYEVEIAATPRVAQGESGEIQVAIRPKPGAEIHKEAPISLKLKGRHVTPAQQRLGRKEMAMSGEDASFTVPFSADEPGEGRIEAELSFYICTDKVCARQLRQASLPVAVDG